MVNNTRKIYIGIALAIIVAIIFWYSSKRETRIIFINEVKVMSEPQPEFCSNCPGNIVVAKISAGESAIILDEDHNKDWHVLKIRTKDGSEGYIFGDIDYKRVNE